MIITWNSEDEFWHIAAQKSPLWYRIFRWSLTPEQIEAEAGHCLEWCVVKRTLTNEDLIWPFEFNVNTLAYRKGFVFIRNGQPIGGIVTLVS